MSTNQPVGGLQRAGAAIAPLLLNPARWIHRRVETIEFIDDSWVRRRTSVDFQLPVFAVRMPYRAGANPRYLAPLALLTKRGLRHFDLFDERGRSLSLLTRRENVRVASSALVSHAHTYLRQRHGRTLEAEIAADLAAIAATTDPSIDLLDEVFAARGRARVNRRLLSKDPRTQALVGALLDNFIVLVALENAERRVIKYAYDEPLPPPVRVPAGRRVGEALGWIPNTVIWSSPSVGLASSYHLEVEAPRDLEITHAKLVATDSRGNDYLFEHGASGRRAHLHALATPQDAVATASISLRARREGLIRAALVLAFLTSALVTAGAIRVGDLERDPASAVALLAVLPALLAAYLARPDEHALASAILVGVRALVAVVGLVAVVPAAVLVGGLGTHWERMIWLACAGLGWAATAGLTLSYLLPRMDAER